MPTNLNRIKSLHYLLYGLAVLPIFIFRDFTPDNELRYLSIADEALRNGSIFTFTNHGIIYADKPPLYLWIVMLGKLIFGHHNMLFLGLFSYVPALVILYTMDKWVKNVLSESLRLTGQLMLITSGFFIGSAVVLRMDMLMCMFIVLSLYTFFRMYSGEGKKLDSYLFPFFVFMAIFSKGPIGIIIPLVSSTVFLFIKGKIRQIGKYWGWETLAILLTLCAVWFGGVYAEGGPQYLNNLLFNQTVNRAVNSLHHQEPFYFYLTTIWYSLAPWSLFYIGVLAVGLKKKLATTDMERFFLVVALSTLVTLSLFSSKLAVYMLPTFPFFAYIALLWLPKIGSPRWIYLLVIPPAAILCLALPGLFVAQQFIDSIELNTSPLVIMAAAVLSISGIIAAKQLRGHKLNSGITSMGIGMLLAVFVISFAVPKYNSIIGLKELCDHAKSIATPKGEVNYYYCNMRKGDNLDVYLGTKLEILRVKDLYQTNSTIKRPAILFLWHKAVLRNDSLQIFIKGKPMYQSGGYDYVEIE